MDKSFKKSSIIFCFISFFTFAGNDEEFFLRGNKLYKQQDYHGALQAYEGVNHKGRAVLYNMGNCYYHINDYPQALVFFARAECGATPQEMARIKNNKQIILEKMGKLPKDTTFRIMESFLYYLFPYFSLFFLQMFFLVCLYMIIYSLHANVRFKKSIFMICSISIILTGLLLGVCYIKKYTTSGVFIDKNVLVYSGPDKGFHVVATGDYADYVFIKEKREGWYKVQYSDKIGWVEVKAIQIV